ncbi:Retrovirus-related Pol polyprotein from transposon RE2-like protein [Drosera capensis]
MVMEFRGGSWSWSSLRGGKGEREWVMAIWGRKGLVPSQRYKALWLVARHSTSDYWTYFGGNLITWRAKKQTVAARSSTETEYRAMTLATSELTWLERLLFELGVQLPSPSTLYCDNKVVIHIAENLVFHERTKHKEGQSVLLISEFVYILFTSEIPASEYALSLESRRRKMLRTVRRYKSELRGKYVVQVQSATNAGGKDKRTMLVPELLERGSGQTCTCSSL